VERESDSEPIRELSKLPCPDTKGKGCGSSDAFTVYSDGHGHCFSCDDHYSPREVAEAGYDTGEQSLPSDRSLETKKRTRVPNDVKALIEAGTYRALPGWKIRQDTCEAWDYRTLIDTHGNKLHLAVYRDEHGQVQDVKVRNTGPEGTGKDFYWASGKAPKGLVYGAHRLGNGGKMLVIAMGEKDTLTVSQLWGNKFPVISPQAESQIKDLAKYLPQISRYEKVMIVQDMDEPGLRAGQKVARMLPPGKAHLVKLPSKDANETLLKHGEQVLISAIHNATPFRPDGIVDADELDGELLIPTKWGLSLPWPFLTNWTKGMRPGEVWVNGAGTGVGKSDWAGEIVQHLIKPVEDGGECVPVAVFNYEAGPVRTLKMLVGKLVDKRFNQPPPEGPDGLPNFDGFLYWQPEDMERARVYRRERCAKLYINDHKGAVDWPSVKDRLRFLRHEAGIQAGVVDPVAALVAQEDNDVKALDRIFAEAKGLAEELQITLLFNSHLTRPKDGKSHEEGGRVELRHFRGSGAIVMWASYVFGEERDTQSDDANGDTTLRCLKDREFGDATGYTRNLVYNTLTGRLEESIPELMKGPEPPPLEVPA
jgi:twinkle protein